MLNFKELKFHFSCKKKNQIFIFPLFLHSFSHNLKNKNLAWSFHVGSARPAVDHVFDLQRWESHSLDGHGAFRSRRLQGDSLWIFRRRLVFHYNLLARLAHSKWQPCHSAAQRWFTCRQTPAEPSGWQCRLLTSDRLPEVFLPLPHPGWILDLFIPRSQSSGPAAVTETSHRGVWSLEIAEECDGAKCLWLHLSG